MFNSPILDITIGLVFIFLLYSLLATTVNEAIASLLGLRARMLRNAIVDHMLSDASKDSRLQSIWKGIVEFLAAIPRIILGPAKGKGKIGDHFFDHPIIKNYAATRLYSLPSYLSSANFSTILIDLLKKDFNAKLDPISKHVRAKSAAELTEEIARHNLETGQDMVKIKELIDYYRRAHLETKVVAQMGSMTGSESKEHANVIYPFIDLEVLDTLELLLKKSNFDLDEFRKQLESWFNDTMDRVSGWYKRQTQFILFCLGLFMAVMFNVDSIGITNKLSTNTDTRKILVDQAISFSDRYEKNSDVQNHSVSPSATKPDSTYEAVNEMEAFLHYQAMVDSIRALKRREIDTVNTLLALGWGDYGLKRDSAKVLASYFKKCNCSSSVQTPAEKKALLEKLYNDHWLRYKVPYILSESFHGRRLIGLIVTAFAICLGAPFWFDMLNKLIKLRSTGVKENGDSNGNVSSSDGGNSTPIIINNHLIEEAQG